MNAFFVLLLLFQLFYFASCCFFKTSNINSRDRNEFFQKDYDYFESRERFYKFHKIQRNWLDAKKQCDQEGALLWYPEDQEEVDLILEYWKKRQPALLKLHVGISDLLFEGQWETVDGRPKEDIWNKWGLRETNNAFKGDCAVMKRDFYTPGEVDLIDGSCSSYKPFICKKALIPLDWNFICGVPDIRYVFDPELGKCYKFHSEPLSWNEAYSACTAEGSYLAVINSEKEKDFLVKMVADALTQIIPWNNVDVTVHLGFHNQFGEGWQTVTGTPLDESGYVAWGDNQPDGGDNELCGTMFFDGLYNDMGCDKPTYFICEHDIYTE